jgi:hypothetical protein
MPGRLGRLLDAMPQLLAEHPALSWLVAETLAGWTTAMFEAEAAVWADRAALARFLKVPDFGMVARLDATSGDIHNGRRPLLIRADGKTVVFKPRDVAIDAAVTAVAEAASLAHLVPEHLIRIGYGYATAITPKGPANAAQRRAVAFTGGQLLALSWLLGLSDLHIDNVVARDRRLIAIDLECAFGADRGFGDAARADVCQSGLLPAGTPIVPDDSPFGGMPSLAPRTRAEAADLVTAVQAGMSDGLRRIGAHIDEIEGVLKGCPAVPVRVVLRPTRAYVEILHQAAQPNALRTIDARARTVAVVRGGLPPRWQAIAKGEFAALLRGDVPRVEALAGGRDLVCGGAVALEALSVDGLSLARQRLHQCRDGRPLGQARLIAASLGLRWGVSDRSRRATMRAKLAAPVTVGEPWLVVRRSGHTARLDEAGPWLADGLSGCAAVYAALSKGDGIHLERACVSVRRSLELLSRPGPWRATSRRNTFEAARAACGLAAAARLTAHDALTNEVTAFVDTLAAMPEGTATTLLLECARLILVGGRTPLARFAEIVRRHASADEEASNEWRRLADALVTDNDRVIAEAEADVLCSRHRVAGPSLAARIDAALQGHATAIAYDGTLMDGTGGLLYAKARLAEPRRVPALLAYCAVTD